ncbi:MAG: YCF48-related protein [Ignavibacteria bacterium]|nr:YCF48-related protein [Ignavibacteria bacterium]
MAKKIIFTLLCIAILTNFCLSQSSRWRLLLPVPTFDVAVNPHNINTIFVGGEGNVVYRSYDAGRTWDTLVIFARLYASRLNNVLILPNDTNVLLVGGLNFGNIVRSTDQGKTWSVVLAKEYAIDLNGKAMLYKPDEPNVVFAGDFKWSIIYRSTDNGRTWDSISTVPEEICSLGIREDSTNILLVGSIYGGIFVSTDTGKTWKFADYLRKPDSLQRDVEITRIEFSQRDPRVGYAVVTYLFSANKNNGGLHKTTDGGYNWDLLAFPDTSIWALAVKSRGSVDEIFIGGYTEDFWNLDTNLVPGVGIVRISTDGGLTWLNFDDKVDWVIHSIRGNSDFYTIQCINYDTIYAFGDNGVFKLSYNRGRFFSINNLDEWVNIRGSYFHNSKVGFVCGYNGALLKTTNGGFSWRKIDLKTNSNLYGIVFLNSDVGLVVGDKSSIYKTINGGETWVPISLETLIDIKGIKRVNDSLIVWGSKGEVLLSKDMGASWLKVATLSNEEIKGIERLPSGKFIVITNSGKIFSTYDFISFRKLYEDNTFNPTSVAFYNDFVGFVSGKQPYFLQTTDGGESWKKQRLVSNRIMNAMVFSGDSLFLAGQYATLLLAADLGNFWAPLAGGSGPRANMWRAYYYENQGREMLFMATEAGLFVLDYPLTASEIHGNSESLLKAFVLPGNNSLFLDYKSPKNNYDKIVLRLFNILGQLEFETELPLFNSKFQDFVIFPFRLTSGLYLIQVTEGQSLVTKKILVD